jgi:hypothetical protein
MPDVSYVDRYVSIESVSRLQASPMALSIGLINGRLFNDILSYQRDRSSAHRFAMERWKRTRVEGTEAPTFVLRSEEREGRPTAIAATGKRWCGWSAHHGGAADETAQETVISGARSVTSRPTTKGNGTFDTRYHEPGNKSS